MSIHDNYGPWHVQTRFADGSTYRVRALFEDGKGCIGQEERIFNADGTLRPLPDGRTSPADFHNYDPSKLSLNEIKATEPQWSKLRSDVVGGEIAGWHCERSREAQRCASIHLQGDKP